MLAGVVGHTHKSDVTRDVLQTHGKLVDKHWKCQRTEQCSFSFWNLWFDFSAQPGVLRRCNRKWRGSCLWAADTTGRHPAGFSHSGWWRRGCIISRGGGGQYVRATEQLSHLHLRGQTLKSRHRSTNCVGSLWTRSSFMLYLNINKHYKPVLTLALCVKHYNRTECHNPFWSSNENSLPTMYLKFDTISFIDSCKYMRSKDRDS